MKKMFLILGILLVFCISGCSADKPSQQTKAPAATQQTKQQTSATMKVTIPQFVEIYNKEIKQRHGDKSALGTEKPVRADIVMYDIPDGKGSILIINYNPADSRITTVTFTVQGETGEKFDRKSLRAWTAAVISATYPGISNDDIIDIRGEILGGSPVTKNGIFYMSQYTERGSPFFQIIARAK